jgi:hypothetical protein
MATKKQKPAKVAGKTTKKASGGTGTTKKLPAQPTKKTTQAKSPVVMKGGRLLSREPIVLPRQPLHHYGTQKMASSLCGGEVLYIGDRYNLSEVGVISVTPEKSNPRSIIIEVGAIHLIREGKVYTSAERVLLQADSYDQIAVKRSSP